MPVDKNHILLPLKKNRVAVSSNYRFQFNTADSARKSIFYNIRNLPSWLKYDSVKQLLYGIAVRTRQYPVHLVAFNASTEVHQRSMLTVANQIDIIF